MREGSISEAFKLGKCVGIRECDGVLPSTDWVPMTGYSVSIDRKRVDKKISENRATVARLLSPSLDFTSVIMLDPNDPDTQVHGLKKRLLRALPSLEILHKNWLEGSLKFPKLRSVYGKLSAARIAGEATSLRKRLEGFVDLWLKHNLVPLSKEPDFEEWLERGTWTEAQKVGYRKLWYEEMRQMLPKASRCGRVSPFVKAESYPEIKACRWINAANDLFKIAAGPWFWSIEECVYDVHGDGPKNPAGQSWFIKHTPVPERPAKIGDLREHGENFVSSDFTSFEASFSPLVMKMLEVRLYRYMTKSFPAVSKFLEAVLLGKRSGTTRIGVHFERPGGRMSGDPCTSIGNGFSNLMLWLFWAHITGKRVCGYVEGDDGLFAVTSDKPNPEPQFEDPRDLFACLGFDVKAIWLDSPLDASFCGVLCSDDLQIIRDPRLTINKFAWSLSNPLANEKMCARLLRAKGLSLAYELPHCPVLRTLAEWALRTTKGSKAFFEDKWKATATYVSAVSKGPPQFAPTQSTRSKFETLYGVSVQQQLDIESRINAGDLSCLEDLTFSKHQAYARWNNVVYG